MSVVALIVWLATAGIGLYLLAVWLIEYDRDFQQAAATRLPIPVIGSHAILAVLGIAVWSAYLLLGDDRLAWLAVIIIGCVALLGLTLAVRWVGVYRSSSAAPRATGELEFAARRDVPPERNFPVAVVITHGILAVTTVVLVLLTALNVDGS